MLARGQKEAMIMTALYGGLTAKTGSPLFVEKQAGFKENQGVCQKYG